MSLDLEEIIPNSDSRWVVKNNKLCYNKLTNIPLLSVMDGVVWVALDRRLTNQVILLVEKLMSKDIKFFFCDRFVIHGKEIYEQSLPDIIQNYIRSISDEKFFDLIFDLGFDYVENITEFMTLYECHELFSEIFMDLKEYLLRERTNWFLMKKYYIVKREDIREFISVFERQIKLTIFLT